MRHLVDDLVGGQRGSVHLVREGKDRKLAHAADLEEQWRDVRGGQSVISDITDNSSDFTDHSSDFTDNSSDFTDHGSHR